MLPCVTLPGETFSGIAAGVTALNVFPVEYITPAVTAFFVPSFRTMLFAFLWAAFNRCRADAPLYPGRR